MSFPHTNTASRLAAAALINALAGSSACAADDLIATRTLRSLAAEASLVLRLQAEGKVSGTYSRAMSKQIAQQLQQLGGETGDAQVRQTANAAIMALTARDAGALQRISDHLFAEAGPH